MGARHVLVARKIKALRAIEANPVELSTNPPRQVWGIEPGPWDRCPDCGAGPRDLCVANCPRYREDPDD